MVAVNCARNKSRGVIGRLRTTATRFHTLTLTLSLSTTSGRRQFQGSFPPSPLHALPPHSHNRTPASIARTTSQHSNTTLTHPPAIACTELRNPVRAFPRYRCRYRCRCPSIRACPPHDRRLTRAFTTQRRQPRADIMQVARTSLSFPAGSPPQPAMYANSPHGHGLMAAPAAFNRSFSDMNGYQQHAMEKPQIYTVRDTRGTLHDQDGC